MNACSTRPRVEPVTKSVHLYRASKVPRTIRDSHRRDRFLFSTPLRSKGHSTELLPCSVFSSIADSLLICLAPWNYESQAPFPRRGVYLSFWTTTPSLPNNCLPRARSSMQSTSMPLSPVKDGRRILGEKDSNACLSPAHQSKHSLSVTGTPVKRALFTNASPKKLLPSPIFAGQKRTRGQVDEIDANNGHVREPRGLEDESSQSTVKHDAQPVSCILAD